MEREAGGAAVGPEVGPGYARIEVRVSELRKLFNEIDPSPFHAKDLDAKAEDFIVGWARDLPGNAPLALIVHVDRIDDIDEGREVLSRAIREYFSQRALAVRQELRQLFRVGRTSLLIGLACLATAVASRHVLLRLLSERPLGHIAAESLLIGGWVAMWRPLEIFLYDWWPLRAKGTLYDRLAAMPVRITTPSAGPGSGARR